MGTPENEELLSIVSKGYVETRYEQGFMLNCTLAYRFLELVESFFKLADKLCDAEFKAQQLVLNEIKQMGAEGSDTSSDV